MSPVNHSLEWNLKNGEDGIAQSYFEYLKIPYTHSGVVSSMNSMNKVISKQIFKRCNILSPKYAVINIDQANKINLGAKNLCLNGQCITAGDFVKLKGLLNQHQLDRRYTHTIQPNSANNRYALKKEGPHLVLRNIDAGHDSRWHMATHGSLT